MVNVSEVSKSFKNIKAVEDLSFEVKEGEIVGLLGPNGAGKSTTMRIMSGFLAADYGDVIMDDISVMNNPIEAQKFIGYLPENNPLYKDMLVSDLLSISARLKGMSKSAYKDSLSFVVPSVSIEEVFYRPINELSKGYKQRVGIAMAIIHRPKFLIMDEPTEGLDPNQRAEIRKLIKHLSKDHTIIISTHVMQEVEAICSRMVIINQGRKVADGSVEELSNGARNEKIIKLKLQGKNIEKSLGQIKKIKKLDFDSAGKDIVNATIVTDLATTIQPEISEMAASNKWIIWELTEQKQQLEDVFKKLTQQEL